MLVGFGRVIWERLQSLAKVEEYWIMKAKPLGGLVGLGTKFGY